MRVLDSVRIVEVGPRDGLQNIADAVPTSTKIQLIERLRAAGLNTIEATSVVSPRAVPQLADSQQLLGDPTIQSLIGTKQLRIPVLVPNKKGLEIAIKHNVKDVAVFVSASEGFSKANINCTVQEGINRARDVAAAALEAGLAVRGYISCIFADPYDGPVSSSAVLSAVQQLLELGCYEISLGDTLGIGTPADVSRLLTFLLDNGIPAAKLAGHFHDTYGQATGNVWTAYQFGVRVFDSSVGGLGGCPYAPGARGNAATEDLVYMFEQAGIRTGVDLEELAEVGVWISSQLGKANDSRAGAAIAAKRKAKQTSTATATVSTQRPTRIAWELDNQADGVDIYRSGVNVKLVLNRPAYGNALTMSMIDLLTEFFIRAATDRSISRIVTTARGKFFCIGMDLGKDSTPVGQVSGRSNTQYDRLTHLFDLIAQAPQLTIACINGSCFGSGVGLAFACDVRVAIESARLTLSEAKLGLVPTKISKRIVRQWGLALAKEAMLSGRPVTVNELMALGLIAHIASDAESLERALESYLGCFNDSSANTSRTSKELGTSTMKDNGSGEHQKFLRKLLGENMRPDKEAAWGIKQFRRGANDFDWDTFAQSEDRARL